MAQFHLAEKIKELNILGIVRFNNPDITVSQGCLLHWMLTSAVGYKVCNLVLQGYKEYNATPADPSKGP